MNEEFLAVIKKHERISNLYDIGPVQRAEIEEFIYSICRTLDNGYYSDFHQFMIDCEYLPDDT